MALLKKRGRRAENHVSTIDGETIKGLARRPSDGRWRIIATGMTYTEHDERKAIDKFYRLTTAPETAEQTYDRLMHSNVIQQKMWIRWFVEQIATRPKWIAKVSGVEELAYLKNVKPPEPLPTFAELEKTWLDHARCSRSQRQKVLRAWHDFVATSRIGDLDDIKAQTSLDFRDNVWKRTSYRRDGTSGPISPKQQMHFFSSLKTLLRFNMKRGVAPDAINKALANMQCLEASDVANDSDPRPIERNDFQSMLKLATGDDRAMLLLMLNGAFYMKEVLALEWSDIDFKRSVIITRRKKRGQCIRVCVLWAETLEALAAMERKGESIFYNYAGSPLTVSGGQLRFTKLAEAAKIKVTASQLRDGAYSAAVEAKVSFDLCRLLAGHSCGIADKYVKRQPSMVAPACEAVRAAYLG